MGEDSSRFKPKDNFFTKFLHGLKPSNKKELVEVISEAQDRDVIDENTEGMLKGVFDISRLRVGDIMIPRSSMVTIDINSSLKDAIEIIAKTGHSRYPVSCEDKDHIQGVLMAKDLLPYAIHDNAEINMPELLRPPVIVPESKRVDSMLKEFQAKHNHLAVVVDEFGGVCGLVTIEDILELIVGEIGDEYDVEESNTEDIVKSSDNIYLLSGSTPIDSFNEYFKTTLPKVDVDTVAGLVMHAMGHLPKKDEVVHINKYTFKVLALDKRQIGLLQLTINQK